MHKKRRVGLEYTAIDGNAAIWYNKVQAKKSDACTFIIRRRMSFMKKIRIFAMLMSLLILFSFLTGCKDGASDVSNASSQPAVESTESLDESQAESSGEVSETVEVDGREPYENALAAFEKTENFEAGVEIETTRSFGTEKQTETFEGTVKYLGYGSKDPSVLTTATCNFGGDDIAKYRLTSIDGVDYLVYNEQKFCSEQTDEALAYFLDPELYGKITVTPESVGKDEKVLLFSEAKDIEEWIAYEYAVLVSAEAEVYLDAKGMISGYEYTVAYNQGTVLYETVYKVTYSPYAEDELPVIEPPEDVRNYTEVADVDAVMILDKAIVNLENLSVYQLTRDALWLDQITSNFEESSTQTYYFDYNGEFAESKFFRKMRQIYNPNKRDFDIYNIVHEATIIDGKKTVKADNKESTVDISDSEIEKYIEASAEDRIAFAPALSHISELAYETDDGYITVTVKCNREYGKIAYKNICEYLDSDTELIDEYFNDYSVEQAEYMITVDVDTCLPVAVNFDFSALHETNIKELQGSEFEIGVESICRISPASPDIYFDIAEEHHPDFDAEPEDSEKAKPLFYKVTDANGKTMWLLGTIHVGDNRTAYLPDEIYEALGSSNALAVEVDTIALGDEFDEEGNDELLELYRKAYYYDGESDTLKKHIDEKLYRDTVERARRLGMGFFGDYLSVSSERFRPNYWYGLFENVSSAHTLGVYYNKGVDRRLLGIAKEKNVKIYEIEDRYRQYTMDIDYSDAVHELNLLWEVYGSRNVSYSDSMEMFNLWCDGDYESLLALVNAEYDTSNMTANEVKAYEEYMKALQDDRDALMLEKAKEYLESGETVFYAVGLAHLLNEKGGLVFKLAEAGYTVELVEYK